MNTALLLIDIQNIYFTDGPYLLNHPEATAVVASKLLDDFRGKKLPVIHIQHMFNTAGYPYDSDYLNSIHSSVSPLANEAVIKKTTPSSFYKTELDTYLHDHNITELVVCGMMSHMCIDTTVRACKDRGIKVTVIEDACTTKDLKFKNNTIPADTVHQAFMAGLNGMFANVMSYDDFAVHR